MNFDNLGTIFDIILFLACIYCGYSWYWMRKHGQMHHNPILITAKNPIENCKDPKGYIRYMSPRLFIFSLIGTIFGAINLYGTYTGIPQEAWFVIIIILFVNIIWFAFVLHQSVKRFWEPEPQIRL